MRFGLILLGIIMLVSLAGSIIPQNNEVMFYVRTYPNLYSVILALKLNQVFTSWYFLVLVILLCLNLSVCTYRQLKQSAVRTEVPSSFNPEMKFAEGQEAEVRAMLEGMKCRAETNGEVTRYTGKEAGRYGSFLLHFGILLTTVFWALGMVVPKIMDQTCYPGEAITLEDGTSIRVDRFSIEDETGKLDYASVLTAASPDGKQKKTQEIRVNEPLRFGSYKIYQQTYGTAGRIRITNTENGAVDVQYLTDPCFLSIDQRNGIYFEALYPGYYREEDGSFTLITSTDRSYPDPVYRIQSITDGMSAAVLAFPGEEIHMGDITFTFLSPAEYPGLRIKHIAAWLYGGLYFSFGLMVAALYLCFFTVPVAVKVTEEGYVICSPKDQEGLEIALEAEKAAVHG